MFLYQTELKCNFDDDLGDEFADYDYAVKGSSVSVPEARRGVPLY
jgi:hypothetical protein